MFLCMFLWKDILVVGEVVGIHNGPIKVKTAKILT